MSINTDKRLRLFAMDLWIASWRRRRWSAVSRRCRKPDCEIWSTLWYSQNQLRRHKIIFSKSLQTLPVMDIGL